MNTGSHLDFRDRVTCFSMLEDGEFDLLVIGGGITGCGVARDAVMRGLRVALVDANDFGAGTSSRSSKLIHGGIRYLAQGHVGLVKEAATERKTLRRIAPHLAQTTKMIVPGRSKASLLKFKTGLIAYEKLGNVETDERHESWDVERLRREEPHFVTDGMAGAVVYPEYTTDDARLTLANARSAVEHGATVLNYARVDEILVEDDRACGAIVSDTVPGATQGARIRAKIVINAAGPWVDAVRKIEDAEAPKLLQLTKGIHVVLKRERLPVHHTVVMGTKDKRSIFVVPRDNYVYFGTTDTFYSEVEYWPEITRDDVDYLLDVGAQHFDNAPFEDEDIVSMWSGVRPLMSQKGKTPSEISRKDEILHGPTGVISIAGGKLTSFRLMAERIVDMCAQELGREVPPCETAEQPLPGGDLDTVAADLHPCEFPDYQAARAVRLYGSEAEAVFAEEASLEAEVTYAVLCEGAVTLEDYWVRRSGRARFDVEGGIASLEPASKRMKELLDWSESERERQVDSCRAIRDREMACVQQVSRSNS